MAHCALVLLGLLVPVSGLAVNSKQDEDGQPVQAVHLFRDGVVPELQAERKALQPQGHAVQTSKSEDKKRRSAMYNPSHPSEEIWPKPYDKCKIGSPGFGDIFTPSVASDVTHTFASLYKQRPMTQHSELGMGVNHAFAVWNMVRTLQPKIIIQSGVGSGQFTWLLHKAAPKARIVCLDAAKKIPHRLHQALYYTGASYKDFLTFMYESGKDWSEEDRDETLVFFDDDHNQLERLAQMKNVGIKHAIMNNNWYDAETPGANKLTLRQVCVDHHGSRGNGQDNSTAASDVVDPNGHERQQITVGEHDKFTDSLTSMVDVYFEVPPLYLFKNADLLGGGADVGLSGFPAEVHHEVPLFDWEFVSSQGLPSEPNEYQYNFIAYCHVPKFVERKATGYILRQGY